MPAVTHQQRASAPGAVKAAVETKKSNVAFSVISEDPPNPTDLAHDESLRHWVSTTIEPLEESDRRRRVLEQLRDITRQWIKATMISDFGMSAAEADLVGGRIFTTGSYRYNVHTSGSDIDVVLIAPERITRRHFFTTLVQRLRDKRTITDVSFAEEAVVPIISMKFEGVDLDLSFCAIKQARIPDDINMMDDRVLVGLDETSVKSVNGVRVAQALIDLVPQVAVFRAALRFMKPWAKSRGLYSVKFGFPSGIGWAILVAKVCQSYPKLNAAGILFRFFKFYKQWFRADPVATGRPNAAIFITPSLTPPNILPGLPKAWNPSESRRDAAALFPVITPAYPYSNACFNVSKTTLATLVEEFANAHETIQGLVAAATSSTPPSSSASHATGGDGDLGIWPKLLEPYAFFQTFSHYIRVAVSSASVDEYSSYVDFVEAKLRFLWTEGIQNQGHALEKYPQIKIRVFSGRFEEPRQIDTLKSLREEAKKRAVAAKLLSISGGTDAAATGGHYPAPALPANPSSTSGGATPLVTPPALFTAYFFIGMTYLTAKPGAPPLPKPDMPKIYSAFQQVCAERYSSTTRPPQVDIVRRADLPGWLPVGPRAVSQPVAPVGNPAVETSSPTPATMATPSSEKDVALLPPEPPAEQIDSAVAARKRRRHDDETGTADETMTEEASATHHAAPSAVELAVDALLGFDF